MSYSKLNSAFILLAFIMLSCADNFLDVSPRNGLTEKTFWKTEEDAKRALIGIYDLWGGQGNGEDGFPYSFFLFFSDSWTDDAYNSLGWYAEFAKGSISPESAAIKSRYAEIYQIIRRCNLLLAHVDKVPISDATKNKMKGEARFVRAYEYFLIYYHWGEAQLVKKPLSTQELKVPRAAKGGTAKFILEDLEFAIENLPINQPEQGRVDRGAAMGLKARVLLYEASAFSNPSNDAAPWQAAAAAAQSVMDLGKYRLFQTANGEGYAELFDTENENNVEVIFDRENHNSKELGSQLPRLLVLNSTIFMVPTQSLVDSYDTYNSTTDQVVSPDPAKPLENRDPRLKYSIAYHGNDYGNRNYGEKLSIDKSPLKASATGYGILKFLTDEFNPNDPNGPNDFDSPANHILMRYAEILLIYAEAKVEANEIDRSVLNAINAVRARAYGSARAAGTYGVDITTTGSYPEVTTRNPAQLREIVRKERRVEMALEGLRWYDIRRWRTAQIARNAEVFGFNNKRIVKRTFDPQKDYSWPIPQREIDFTGKKILKQNEGY